MEYLKNDIDLPNYDVTNFDYKEEKSIIPGINESLSITATNYAQVTGSRLFIVPNILSRTHNKLISDDSRKFEVVLNSEYKDVDTVVITIPSGYQPEAFPQPLKMDTKFGRYIVSVQLMGDKILYYRSMEQFKGRFPASAYNDLVKFYDQIYRNDRSKVVLVKKTP